MTKITPWGRVLCERNAGAMGGALPDIRQLLNELPALIAKNFPVIDKRGITGHSMGGHGADFGAEQP